MQTQQISATPFGTSNVTSATIDNLTMRISILEEKMNKLNNISTPQTTTTKINTAPLVPPTIIPPTQPTPDLTSIFPKTGGRRKKTLRRKNKRT
jgi:hypothetical protein